MAKLRVHNLSTSVDGYAAGPGQDLEHPLGVGAERLHTWIFATRYGREMIGETGGETGADHDFLVRGDEGIGATIMGRNMFGPVRGPWPDESWTGWWGPTPPYHHPVFVFTHHPRPPLELDGGTVFHFTDEPIEAVLERAVEAAGGQDVRLGGGPATIRAYLRAGLVDELHLAVVPVLLGSGEQLLGGITGYTVADVVPSAAVTHYTLVRS